jgi:hypothetical protein
MALPDKNRSLIRASTVPIEPGLKINIYNYGTKSTAAQVLTAGYFNFGRGYLRPGDRITAHTEADVAANSETIQLKVATVPASGNVTVTDITPAGGA